MARPAFRGSTAHVRVPATSANLGPGFDALGLALSLHDDIAARIGEDGVSVDVAGEGADTIGRDESHLIVRAMRAGFDALGGQPRGIELSCANRIPHGRGLGSSAAAIVAGVLLARALVLGGEEVLPDSEVLALTSRVEGHPDNVAACLLGGITIAWTAADGRAQALRIEPDARLQAVAFIPSTSASTALARRALPEQVPHGDAAFNAARAALLTVALTTSPEHLFAATEDRIHQPYRVAGAPDSAALMDKLRAAGIAAAISGAGPTVLVLASSHLEVETANALAPAGWQAERMAIDLAGARLVR